MDWNLKKMPSWDFSEFEHGPRIDSVSESSSYGGQGIDRNFCVDLKLGQVIDSSISNMALSPSGSSKRARAISGASPAAGCLVDECTSDLSNSKEYHRRHKVCEVHSKTPEVSINGQKQRFCQQCSRFHSLEEFDEGKRSCRKRLDGHNRRRRKPQPDISRAASLFSGHQGATMLQFSNPHMYQTTSHPNHLWSGMVKSEVDPIYPTRHSTLIHNQNPFPESSSGTQNMTTKQQQFNLFHNNGSGSGSGSRSGSGSHLKLNRQPSPPKLLSFEANSRNYEKLFSDGYPPPVRVQSDCALSLLSSSPSQTSCTTLNHVMHPATNSFAVTPNQLDHHGAVYGGLESIMDPNGNNFRHDHNISRDNEPPQTLPFYWE